MAGRLAAVAGVAGIAVLVALVAALALIYGPIPSRRGVVSLPGLHAPVEVRFDRAGAPHVSAVLERDAWRVLGWLHASDRLFQMELRRRAATGRLAEVFGQELVARDVAARAWGHAREAARDVEALTERDRGVLEAYVGGINTFIAERPLPLEFGFLNLRVEPWTTADALAFGRLMFQELTVADTQESAVFAEARARGIDVAVALADASDGIATVVAPEIREVLPEPSPETAVITPLDPTEASAGSNAWALAGSRSMSGKPLLAGDPHLNPERPGVWYAAHLTSADGLDVAGLTLAGVPGVFIGHNGEVAWSITMNQADDVDLFVEKLDDGGDAARHGDTWEPVERRRETVRVKGAVEVPAEIVETRHGPVVENLSPGLALTREWASGRIRQGLGVYLDAARARDGDELRRAWSAHRGPAVNLCWADRSGGFGVGVFGAIPRRRAGNGRFPVPGWLDAYDWDGILPQAELPWLANPVEGFVATANDDWSAARIALSYPGLFAGSDRVLRARQLAGSFRRARIEDMRAMQSDVFSPYAARVVAAMAPLALTDPRANRARAILTSWNARSDLRGPSRLFFAFLRNARKAAASPVESGTSGAWITWSLLDRMITGRAPESLWDDPHTTVHETRAMRIESALAASLDEVERREGSDPAHWSWGRVHQLAYEHPLAAGLPAPVGKRLAFGPVALPGEWHTLNVAGFRLASESFRVIHIPSARIVVDLGDLDRTRLVLPLGQSGQLLDRYATNQMRKWSRGADFLFPFTSRGIAANTVSSMSFVPAR